MTMPKHTDKDFQRLPNKEAIATFEGKTLMTTWHYLDMLAQEHATAFTVAKMMDEDLLKEVQKAMQDAIANGTSFNDFQKRIKGYLMAKGWHSETIKSKDPKTGEIKEVHLGSTRRLKIIYNTNKRTARASARWQRIQKTKDYFPYLEYRKSLSENKRLNHKQYYGLVLHVDSPVWKLIFPPNGYGCKCRTKQLTAKEAEKIGISEDFELEFEDFKNPRTGKTIQVPKGIEPSFAHNHERLASVLKLAEEKHGKQFAQKLQQGAEEVASETKAQLNSQLRRQAIEDLKELEKDGLPPPKEWKKVQEIGFALRQKHNDLFDSINFEDTNAFSNMMMELMERENVKVGERINAIGDNVDVVKEITRFYPSSWIKEANSKGKCIVFNDKSENPRGFHLYINKQWHDYLIDDIDNNDSLKMFSKFIDSIKEGDSLLYLNNLHLNNNDAINVAIHELGHRLQTAMPELDEYFKQFWLDRTVGEKTVKLADIERMKGLKPTFPDNEEGRADKFADVYIGRNYGDDDNPLPLEVLTMAFETVLGSNTSTYLSINSLLHNDPELLYLTIGLLLRFNP